MENKELMEKLLEHPSDNSVVDEEVVSVSTARVMSIRYRIYTLVLIGLIALGVVNYLLPAYDSWNQTRSELFSLQNQLLQYTDQKNQYESDKSLLQLISSNANVIVSCVNQKQGCKALDPRIRDNFSFVRSFIELNNLSDSQMEINEKLLLSSIHGFLLGNASSGVLLNSISFGDPSVLSKQLWGIPISLSITFPTKEGLLAFVDNVDRFVYPDVSLRVLYKIDQISYDITNSQSSQTVSVNLHAFYYK